MFHSPLRLLAVSLTVAAILVGGMTLVGSDHVRPAGREQPARSMTQAPTRPSPTRVESTPSELVTARDRHAATAAARAFVDTWTSGSAKSMSRYRWLRTIRPLVTSSLYRGLRVTDLSRIPPGDVQVVRAEAIGAFSAGFTVRLDSGLRLSLHVVSDHGRWAVSDIRPVDA